MCFEGKGEGSGVRRGEEALVDGDEGKGGWLGKR